MKIKILITALLLITLCGCAKLARNNIKTIETIYINEKKYNHNPITVGLYQQGKLINSYKTKFIKNHDLATFNLFYTNQKDVRGYSVKNNFKRFYNQYKNIEQYKTGFYISFRADNKLQELLILDPHSKYALSPYMFIYLYDAYHQKDGAHYTHLELADMKPNTVFTSIKLYLVEASKITSPIYLEAFTYLDEDIKNNTYCGQNKYSIIINNS